MLRSYTRLKPRRDKKEPRPGRVDHKTLGHLRNQVWTEQGGRCDECAELVHLEHPDFMRRMHLAHRRNKRMFGDGRENLRGLCYRCHIVIEHGYGVTKSKPCPPKPRS